MDHEKNQIQINDYKVHNTLKIGSIREYLECNRIFLGLYKHCIHERRTRDCNIKWYNNTQTTEGRSPVTNYINLLMIYC